MLVSLASPIQSIWNRSTALRYIVGFIALYIFALPIINQPVIIDEQVGEAEIFIFVEQQYFISHVTECINMNWDFNFVREIYLNGNGIVGPDAQTMCDTFNSLNFRVVLRDGTEQFYTIGIYETHLIYQAILLLVIVKSLPFLHIVEKTIINVANRLRPIAPLLFIVTCIFFILLMLLSRAYVAFTTPTILDWDETYYASIASTYANGFGLYPYIQGYAEIPYMGGVGLFSASYAIAYQVIGPYLWALRLVAFLFSVIGLIGIFVLLRKWYGSATGLVAVTITLFLYLFDFTNSIRPDSFGIVAIVWSLFFFAIAQDRKDDKRWQLAVGFLLAIGLQAHLHTAVVAVACGFVYLSDALSKAYRRRNIKYIIFSPMTAYVMGYVLGFGLFFIINILPNPDGFFRSASVAHLLHTNHRPSAIDTENLLTSFFSPVGIIRQEVLRYEQVFNTIPTVEATLWFFALLAIFFTRKHRYDRFLRLLFLGGIVGGAIVLNNQNQYYLAQIVPILSLSLAPFITHGFQHTGKVNLGDVTIKSWAILIIFMLGFYQLYHSTYQNIWNRLDEPLPQLEEPEIAIQVKSIATPECHIVGDAGLYVPHFIEYPQFTSSNITEFRLGSTFYGLNDQPVEYWKQKSPDLVFGGLINGLDSYIVEMQYIEVASLIWVKPDGLNLTTECVLNY